MKAYGFTPAEATRLLDLNLKSARAAYGGPPPPPRDRRGPRRRDDEPGGRRRPFGLVEVLTAFFMGVTMGICCSPLAIGLIGAALGWGHD